MTKQTFQVLEMLRNGPINRIDAYKAGVLNVTARISNLRDLNYEIDCIYIKTHKPRFGTWVLTKEP